MQVCAYIYIYTRVRAHMQIDSYKVLDTDLSLHVCCSYVKFGSAYHMTVSVGIYFPIDEGLHASETISHDDSTVYRLPYVLAVSGHAKKKSCPMYEIFVYIYI